MLFFVQTKSARFGQITRMFYAISQKLFKIIQKFQLHVKIQTIVYQKQYDLNLRPKKGVLVKFLGSLLSKYAARYKRKITAKNVLSIQPF